MPNLQISSIRNRPRLDRVGIIRLGERTASGPRELDHFFFDAPEAVREKAKLLFGEAPRELGITFFSDCIEEVFRCTYMKWGAKAGKGTPYVVCEGNGEYALAAGKKRSCPCPALAEHTCKKTTILKFLVPELTMAGYFMLVTKSEYSSDVIETSLRLAHRTSGLLMKPHILRRTEGFATIRCVKVRKYFVSIHVDDLKTWPAVAEGPRESTRAIAPGSGSTSPETGTPVHESALFQSIARIAILPDLPQSTEFRLEQRRVEGRRMIREKIHRFITAGNREELLEAYARKVYGEKFEALSLDQLLHFWKKLEEPPTIKTIARLN